eukprot:TRINITY_DN533_c0_g1_i1.p1 TRINITY_DN533_c0_g1~~TRINITY_DN533_c0_g1_i1.p1  ORF type:complete len:291 (+),score=72.59 TRINITY_DN533_c0_g1_i1:116-874(+)
MSRHCQLCPVTQNLQICSSCKGVYYCGKDHQRFHWKEHKPLCLKVKEALEKGSIKETLDAGDGKTFPSKGHFVIVHYTGRLVNGEVFDSSRGSQPFQFAVGLKKVIKGWDELIPKMSVGEKARLFISPQHGYGSQQSGPIPPNSTLIFDVELLFTSPKEVSFQHSHEHGEGCDHGHDDGHGHSHDGGDHGHSHDGGDHGHSHDGGDHGHSHDGGDHGHSHDDGHGHSHDGDHGHSHDGGHGHSHDGDHGHSH